MTADELTTYRDRLATELALLRDLRCDACAIARRLDEFQQRADAAIPNVIGLLAAAEIVLDEARRIQRARAEAN